MGVKDGKTGEDSIRPDTSASNHVPPQLTGLFSAFMGIFGKQSKTGTTDKR